MDSSTYGPGQQAPTNPSPLHAALAIGSLGSPAWTASYDAAGNMTCRAPTSATTCAGTPTGATLSYDNEGRLSGWQNAPSSPTTTDSYLYDGDGNRVEQFVSSGATTTATTYVANVEELSTTSGITSTTTYYYAGSQRVAEAVNAAFSYQGNDSLGSADVALDASGTTTAAELYAPYGSPRYSSGTTPGSYVFTGQRTDATSGLDYYNARYYDPVAGQFVSGDSAPSGLDRYAYVGDNPESRIDPTGHDWLSSALSWAGTPAHSPGARRRRATSWASRTSSKTRRPSMTSTLAYRTRPEHLPTTGGSRETTT